MGGAILQPGRAVILPAGCAILRMDRAKEAAAVGAAAADEAEVVAARTVRRPALPCRRASRVKTTTWKNMVRRRMRSSRARLSSNWTKEAIWIWGRRPRQCVAATLTTVCPRVVRSAVMLAAGHAMTSEKAARAARAAVAEDAVVTAIVIDRRLVRGPPIMVQARATSVWKTTCRLTTKPAISNWPASPKGTRVTLLAIRPTKRFPPGKKLLASSSKRTWPREPIGRIATAAGVATEAVVAAGAVEGAAAAAAGGRRIIPA